MALGFVYAQSIIIITADLTRITYTFSFVGMAMTMHIQISVSTGNNY